MKQPEIFEVGEQVYFCNPKSDPAYQHKLELYIRAMGKNGPFFVVKTVDSGNPEAHPQTITVGSDVNTPLEVSYSGGRQVEPLEVSGYWLTKEGW